MTHCNGVVDPIERISMAPCGPIPLEAVLSALAVVMISVVVLVIARQLRGEPSD